MFARAGARFWLVSAAIFAASATVTCTFYINFCSLVFRCGCQSLWAGAAMACNIHAAHGKHCPWCSHGKLGYGVVLAFMLIPQLVASTRGGWWLWRLSAALLMFPIAGGVAALAIGMWDGYWSP